MKAQPKQETVVVLDFGAQYGQLIARNIRQCRVYCQILPHNAPLEEIRRLNPMGIVLTGGPASVYENKAPRCDPAIYHSGIPILGICYGFQLMAHDLGGEVIPSPKREFGKTELQVLDGGDLFRGLNPQLIGWMSHGDIVRSLPEGFEITSQTN
ncbi:MAG: GMP synthase (glutamine-hydrolyzing), partial [Armatimonadetes bacterium CG_4_10_14_3_um_filter_59_10]